MRPEETCFWARCGALATHEITWKSGDKNPYCAQHALVQVRQRPEKIEAVAPALELA